MMISIFLFSQNIVEKMTREEIIRALRALAKKHPYADDVGYLWKNPLNPKSRGRRWTNNDLELFRRFQLEYRSKK